MLTGIHFSSRNNYLLNMMKPEAEPSSVRGWPSFVTDLERRKTGQKTRFGREPVINNRYESMERGLITQSE